MGKLNWKNIIGLFIVIGIVALLVYVILLYNHIGKTKTDNNEAIKELVLEETELTTINHMYHFQEEAFYYILQGVDKQGGKWLVFNPEKNKDPDKIDSYKMKDFVSQKQIETEWKSTCAGCTLKKSSPAMIDKTPLWELTYIDEKNRYVMHYISLEDGSTYEKLTLHR